MKINNRKAIVWFRQDLRLHDNETLTDALELCDEVIPVYVFDERIYEGKTSFGFPKVTKYRARFILEAVQDLKEALQSKGSDLVVRYGKPEELIFELARKQKSNWVFCNRERTEEEVHVQDRLEKNLWSIGQEMRYFRGKMLYYTADLPFPVPQTPDNFAQFRKEVEKFVPVRNPLPEPDTINTPLKKIGVGNIPTLEDLGFAPFERDERAVFHFKGGESTGMKRLQDYVWDTEAIANYKNTKNDLLGSDYSSKLSPYLGQGCLSPKMIYEVISRYEEEKQSNASTYNLKFELIWRDFFRFMAKKHGNKIFNLSGYGKGNTESEDEVDWDKFNRWAEGKTGIPFIDANMRELNATGYMSSRGRQNVSSFLINDLQLNWLMGAEYFESLLLDYDPASNYGNWCYIAGVGSDTMERRCFNILSQAQRYDPDGEFVKMWIPEIANLPKDKVHEPYSLTEEEEKQYDFKTGKDYPHPMIEPAW